MTGGSTIATVPTVVTQTVVIAMTATTTETTLTVVTAGTTAAADAAPPGDAAVTVLRTVAGRIAAMRTAVIAVSGAEITGMTVEGMDGTVTVARGVETIMMMAMDVEAIMMMAMKTMREVVAAGGPAAGTAAISRPWLRLVLVPTRKTGGGTAQEQLIGLQRRRTWTDGGMSVGQPMLCWKRLVNCQGMHVKRRSILGRHQLQRKGSDRTSNEISREQQNVLREGKAG